MGSREHGECCWCFAYISGPYIIDGLNGSLCEECELRWLEGCRPPRQPDAIARTARWLRLFFDEAREPPAVVHPLPEQLLEAIAFWLTWHDRP